MVVLEQEPARKETGNVTWCRPPGPTLVGQAAGRTLL